MLILLSPVIAFAVLEVQNFVINSCCLNLTYLNLDNSFISYINKLKLNSLQVIALKLNVNRYIVFRFIKKIQMHLFSKTVLRIKYKLYSS